jgi:hypothetical protein
MSRRKRSEGRAGTGPRAEREGSEARSPSEFDSLGQIRVFRRDVPESFDDGLDQSVWKTSSVSAHQPSGGMSFKVCWMGMQSFHHLWVAGSAAILAMSAV